MPSQRLIGGAWEVLLLVVLLVGLTSLPPCPRVFHFDVEQGYTTKLHSTRVYYVKPIIQSKKTIRCQAMGDRVPVQFQVPDTLFRNVTNQPPKANSAFHPSGVGKWVPASAGKAKTGMVHPVSGWTWGVQVKLWDSLRTRAIPERLTGVFTTRRYTNPRLPLPYLRRIRAASLCQ